jgi:flagellar biosynthesis protein FliP
MAKLRQIGVVASVATVLAATSMRALAMQAAEGTGAQAAPSIQLAAPATQLANSATQLAAPVTQLASPATQISSPAAQAAATAAQLANGSNVPWGIVALLTLLTLIPVLLMCMTPFARLLVIFHFLRQALGTQTTPTNQTLIGLALVLTWFLMEPVGMAIEKNAIKPYQEGRITIVQAVERGQEPMRKFMLHYTREKDLTLFVDVAHLPRPRTPMDLPIRVVAPAYMISELKAGFQVGAVLFLPFLVIDLVVASITTSVGMMQLPPMMISTPLKLLLFVMVDGWSLLIGSLMKSFV